MIEIILFMIMIFIMWINSFLWHEWFHIKSLGILNTGKINVSSFGYTATVDNKDSSNSAWVRLAGGLGSGVLHIFLGSIFWLLGAWYLYVPTITFGVINLAYGFYEWKYGGRGRYIIYGTVLIAMIIIWLLQYYLI